MKLKKIFKTIIMVLVICFSISCTAVANDDVKCPDDGDGCTDNESTETDGQNP
jgi:hypothetical protein